MSSVQESNFTNPAQQVCDLLLNQRTSGGWWAGELSTSALSTATAVMALTLASESGPNADQRAKYQQLAAGGLRWLVHHQNEDGGWGDTVLSVSNISTTMLANAVFHRTGTREQYAETVIASERYIDLAGGVDAVIRRYGKDHTFSVPILTHCALAGTIRWQRVMPLPFELSCVPAKFYAAVKMPVVSYALPALIAIGQVVFKHQGHWNPLVRLIRRKSIKRSLKVLESIQPEHGGFLEATPLTSFVCMSLLGCELHEHPVTKRCLEFIVASVRADGSWPIDTNLTTWVTTLSVNALAATTQPGIPVTGGSSVDKNHIAHGVSANGGIEEFLCDDERDNIRRWLLDQQYKTIHPYTNSPPGGWSWTDLPGGVPDADDTPGAMLALMNLRPLGETYLPAEVSALENSAGWLLNLQNRDGGWPTFCRGWGTLPFDRSSNDLTAHVIRAFAMLIHRVPGVATKIVDRCNSGIASGIRFLQKTQAADGSWLPLWFGNQYNENDENPLYGTAKVVLALRDSGFEDSQLTVRGIQWLVQNQNDDGGWSGRKGLQSSTEETALAVEALAGLAAHDVNVATGAKWLEAQLQQGTVADPTPIGFYFAKLWYFERLYPIIFATAALRRCSQLKEIGRSPKDV